jgi:hypothetical protein
MRHALYLYRTHGTLPTGDTFSEYFDDEWEQHAFALCIAFGCLLQTVGKRGLRELGGLKLE